MRSDSRLARAVAIAATAALLIPAAADAQAMVATAAPAPVAEQIAAAVLSLPTEFRDGAGVMGYRAQGGRLELLRPTKNGMLCLADDPSDDQFHVSCYHDSMDPFMARGRTLREAGTKGAQVDSVRFAEVRAGRIKMPAAPASLYQLFGPKGDFDAKTGKAAKSKALIVIYIPGATEASTGLSTKASDTKPWLMFPGTPKAHIMFSATM